jgi:hypothetical protein
MSAVEAPGSNVGWVNVHADAQRLLTDEPFRHQPEQDRGDAALPVLRDNVDPLELAVALKASRQMAGDEGQHCLSLEGNIGHARQQRVLRMVRA